MRWLLVSLAQTHEKFPKSEECRDIIEGKLPKSPQNGPTMADDLIAVDARYQQAFQRANSTIEPTALVTLCLVGLILRCASFLMYPNIAHPDEVYDYLEQGYQLAAGYGTHVWAYEVGMRSYLLPGILDLIIRLGLLISTSPQFYLGAVSLFLSCTSLVIIIAAYLWGSEAAGQTGAVVCGFFAAVWYELVYFAPHALSETFATNFLVVACLLCSLKRVNSKLLWNILAGISLAVAVFVRIQLAPAGLALLLWTWWVGGIRRPMALGVTFAVTFMIFGLSDWITYKYPFQSVALNVLVNTLGGVGSGYGTMPVYYYLDLELRYDGGLLLLVLIGCLAAVTRFPLLFLEAAVILCSHSLIVHKEYRFIYPAMPFAVTLVGIAATDLTMALTKGTSRQVQIGAVAAMLSLWAGVSWAQAFDGPFRQQWFRGSGEIAAANWISKIENVCGIGVYIIHRSALAGLSRFHHDAPVIYKASSATFSDASNAFNVVIAPDNNLPLDQRFKLRHCWSDGFNDGTVNRRMPRVCVLERPGSCTPGAASDPDPDAPWLRLRQPWRSILERIKREQESDAPLSDG